MFDCTFVPLKTISQLYCKCHCNILAVSAETFPQHKTMMVIGIGFTTQRAANAHITIDYKLFPCPLIARTSKQCNHARLCSEILIALVVCKVRPHQFGFDIESVKRVVSVIYQYELMGVPCSETFWMISKLVVASTDKSKREFASLQWRVRAFVTYLSRTRNPRQESDFYCIAPFIEILRPRISINGNRKQDNRYDFPYAILNMGRVAFPHVKKKERSPYFKASFVFFYYSACGVFSAPFAFSSRSSRL